MSDRVSGRIVSVTEQLDARRHARASTNMSLLILFAGCGDASDSAPPLWRHKPLKSLFQLTRDLDAHEVTIFRADDLDANRKA
jgi:hypothetical protein